MLFRSPKKPKQCVDWVDQISISPLLKAADYVLYSTRWKRTSLPHLDAFHAYLVSRRVELILLGRTPEFNDVPTQVVRFGRLAGLEKWIATTRIRQLDILNGRLKKKARKMGVKFKSKLPIVCDTTLRTCDVLDDRNNLNFVDYGHWSLEGAKYFGEKMAKTGCFEKLIE